MKHDASAGGPAGEIRRIEIGGPAEDGRPQAAISAEEYEKYMGEWVAVAGGRVVAHGKDPHRVREEGRRTGKGEPLVDRIDEPTDEPLIFAGGYLVPV